MKTIIKLTREAELPEAWISETGVLKWSNLKRFAELVRADEREALAQPEQHDRRLQIAMRQWEDWKAYALELQKKLVKYEGGSPMILNTQPEQEPVAWEQFHAHLVDRNFCPRCGKRTADPTTIHTCTPPQSERPWVGLTDKDLLTILDGELDSSDEAFLRFGRAVIAHIKQKNT